VAERWYEIMCSLPSSGWIDHTFAEAACKRIAELEAERDRYVWEAIRAGEALRRLEMQVKQMEVR